MLLSQIFEINKRYQRSIQISKDWENSLSLDGYLVTPTAKQICEQIILGISSGDAPNAWTITGPYGTGKSAFALFLTDLLANDVPTHPEGIHIRADENHQTAPLLPILIQGQRSPIHKDLLDKLDSSLEEKSQKLQSLIDDYRSHGMTNNRSLVTIYETTTEEAIANGFGGLLLIIDEFGKYLEFAAENPTNVDLLLMQDLAESASRSEIPFVLITILHSAFSEYITSVDTARKAEWQKVQGRFTDIAFIEPSEHFLKLIGASIQVLDDSEIEYFQQKVDNILSTIAYDEARNRLPLEKLLPECVPLHPVTALILWPLFRSELSQNERSLFSFLNDRGPYGFFEFLSSTEGDGSLYLLSNLYDYIKYTTGDSVLLSLQARRWAEIDNAIQRLGFDIEPLATEIVKAVGLINLFGTQVGLRASRELLVSIFNENTDILKVLDFLEDESILIYRRFDGAYGIWEGSDVDLDQAIDKARLHNINGNQSERLKTLITLQPIIARANYISTGTMRYYLVDIISSSPEAIQASLEADPRPADGKVVFVLSKNAQVRKELISYAKDITSNKTGKEQLNIFAFPKPIKGLEDAMTNLEQWYWVRDHTPELAGDRVARQEVTAQIRRATKQLFNIAGRTFGLRGYLFSPESSIWIQGGNIHELSDGIKFQKWLSTLSSTVFKQAPRLFNELINREKISTSAAAIRRNLIELMINNEGEELLGITGTPPEYSLYKSVLENGGFYRKRSFGEISFNGLPTKEWRPVWKAMRDFLSTTTTGRRGIIELYDELKSPPFGLREGPLSIIITVLILANKDQIALYEEGRFIPEFRIEIFELLIKKPELFEIQLYKLAEESQAAFNAIGESLIQGEIALIQSVSKDNLLSVVKPLIIFAANLPDYTKKLKSIQPTYAIKVRDLLLKAKDPYKLLFTSLPKALGIELKSTEDSFVYAERLQASLIALQNSYPTLLDQIEINIREAFELSDTLSSREVMTEIITRSKLLIGYTPDPSLKLFLRETSRIGDRDWREVLARAVNNGQPTGKWLESSYSDFQLRLMQLSADFKRLEILVREKLTNTDANMVLQLNILNNQLKTESKIVVVSEESSVIIESLSQKIEDSLNNSSTSLTNKLAAIGKVLEELLISEKGDTNE